MKKVRIYSDGACSGNPGPGGWAAILFCGRHQKEISGGEALTTNNRMELTAAIRALQQLKERCEVLMYTDSEYLKRGITEWVAGWRKRNWMRADKEPVKNRDLWEELDAEVSRHKVHWHWVRGHSGNKWNDAVDQLAVNEVKKIKKLQSEE